MSAIEFEGPLIISKAPTQVGRTRIGYAFNASDVDEFAAQVVAGRVVGGPFGQATYGFAVDVHSPSSIQTFADARKQPKNKMISLDITPEHIAALADTELMDEATQRVFNDPIELRNRFDTNAFVVFPRRLDVPDLLFPQALVDTGAQTDSVNGMSFERCFETLEIEKAVRSALGRYYGVAHTEYMAFGIASFNTSGKFEGRRGKENATIEDAIEFASSNDVNMILIGENTGQRRLGSMPMLRYDIEQKAWHLMRQGGTPDGLIRRLVKDLPQVYNPEPAIARNHPLITVPWSVWARAQNPLSAPANIGQMLAEYYTSAK